MKLLCTWFGFHKWVVGARVVPKTVLMRCDRCNHHKIIWE